MTFSFICSNLNSLKFQLQDKVIFLMPVQFSSVMVLILISYLATIRKNRHAFAYTCPADEFVTRSTV